MLTSTQLNAAISCYLKENGKQIIHRHRNKGGIEIEGNITYSRSLEINGNIILFLYLKTPSQSYNVKYIP